MFPSISSPSRKSAASKTTHTNTNKFKYVNYYVNSKTLWEDQYPPENIEKIYADCTTQMQAIKATLDSMCDEYGIDERRVIQTLTAYSRHLSRLKSVVGVSELKSAKTMKDVIKIVKNNIEFTRREQRRAAELLAQEASQEESQMLTEDNDQDGDGDTQHPSNKGSAAKNEKRTSHQSTRFEDEVFTDEDEEEEEMRRRAAEAASQATATSTKLDLSNTISYLQKRRARTVEPFEKLKRSDSIITPILMKAKKERINVSADTEEDLVYLQRLLEYTLKALDEYALVIEKIEKLCSIFEKYFLSFYSYVQNLLDDERDRLSSNPSSSMSMRHADPNAVRYEKLLEPVIKYDEKRREYMSFVVNGLHNLRRLADTFDDGTHEGVSARRHMSDDAHKLSRRCDCDLIPAALIIPEYSMQLNKCLVNLFHWLDYDRSYAECVRDDLRLVERERKRLNQVRNGAEATFNQLNHKIKLLRETMDSQVADLRDILRKTSSKILDEYDDYSGTFSVMSTTTGRKPPPTPGSQLPAVVTAVPQQQQQQKQQQQTNNATNNMNLIAKYAHLDCAKMLERTGADLAEMEAEMARQNRVACISSKTKMSLLEDKFRYVVNARSSLNKLSSQLAVMYADKCIKQAQMDVWENSYVKLKEIYMCKVNSDTVEKIFYNLDLTSSSCVGASSSLSNNSTGAAAAVSSNELSLANTVFSNFSDSKKSDIFTTLFLLISNSIGSDWIKLYYSLPFYPVRGKETIKKDIDDVVSNLNRGNMEREQCFVSLSKWRRFNSRAKVDDLKASLRSIGRNELVKEIEKILAARESETRARDLKKSSLQEVDARKREIEALHQRLVKYLEKTKNSEQSTQFDFKFATK